MVTHRALNSLYSTHALQAKLADFADGKLKGEKLAKAKERCASPHPLFSSDVAFLEFRVP